MAWVRWHTTRRGRRIGHIQWRDREGRKRSKSTGSSDPKVVEYERRLVERNEEGRHIEVDDPVDAAPAAKRWVAHLRYEGLAAATVEKHGYRLAQLMTHPMFHGVPLVEWSRTRLLDYIATQVWAPRSTRALLQTAKRFRAWALEVGIPIGDFAEGVKPPRAKAYDASPIRPHKMRALLRASCGHYIEPCVALAGWAGLRRADFLALTWAQTDLDGGWIRMRSRKTDSPLRIPIAQTLDEVLRRHRALSGPVCRVPKTFRVKYGVLHRLMDEAGIPRTKRGDGGWHRLRHSCAELLRSEGVDLPTIGAILGHAPGSPVTLVYQHPPESALREAIGRLDRATRG